MAKVGDRSCTGECPKDKPCSEIKVGDPIPPNSRAHLERNACNRCDRSEPEIYYKWLKRTNGTGGRKVSTGQYMDSEGNLWKDDPWIAAKGKKGHGDKFLGKYREVRQTYRILEALNGGRGWQCTYCYGVLDDISRTMGTFDYANHPIGEGWHRKMDRDPHEFNNTYVPNLTQKFGEWPDNAPQMQNVFQRHRAEQDAFYDDAYREKQNEAYRDLQETIAANEARTEEIVDHMVTMGEEYVDAENMDMK